MFIGIVILITVASIAILSIVNNYYIAFVNNYGDINEYYSSKYAIVSTIERWLNTRDNGSIAGTLIVTWYGYPNINPDWSYDYSRIWTWETTNDSNSHTMYITWYIWDYYNSTGVNIVVDNLNESN